MVLFVHILTIFSKSINGVSKFAVLKILKNWKLILAMLNFKTHQRSSIKIVHVKNFELTLFSKSKILKNWP